MVETNEWLLKAKQEKPELNEFITSLEDFIKDDALNILAFEKCIDDELEELETGLKQQLQEDDAKSQ